MMALTVEICHVTTVQFRDVTDRLTDQKFRSLPCAQISAETSGRGPTMSDPVSYCARGRGRNRSDQFPGMRVLEFTIKPLGLLA